MNGARQGVARQGTAWLGPAGHGWARQGKARNTGGLISTVTGGREWFMMFSTD